MTAARAFQTDLILGCSLLRYSILISVRARENSSTLLKSLYTLAKRIYATSSRLARRDSTRSPRSFERISPLGNERSSFSISVISRSSCSGVMERFAHAMSNPLISFCLSNASDDPSDLMTIAGCSPSLSYVVKRYLQPRHSLRRLMAFPSSADRESTTFDSSKPHTGQRI